MRTRRVTDDLLAALNAYAEMAERLGAAEDAARLNRLSARLATEQLKSKQVEELVYDARGRAAFGIERQLSSRPADAPETEALRAEFSRLKSALGSALFPPDPVEAMKVSIEGVPGMPGSIEVYGDAARGRQIASRAVEAVKAFSEAVFTRDLEIAYALCATEMQAWMSYRRFVGVLQKADEQFGGPAVSYDVENCSVLEDPAARDTPDRDRLWPPSTPKQNKRAVIGTFWFTRPEERRGRWVAFWVSEEPGGYRIAKFDQYLQ